MFYCGASLFSWVFELMVTTYHVYLIIKTKKLTASKVGAGAFKNIKKNATFKVPSGKVNAYKKIVKAKGASKTVKVKK